MACWIVLCPQVHMMGRMVRHFIALAAVIGAAGHCLGAEPAADARHSAYIAPCAAPPLNVKDATWPANTLDRFILARLEKERLAPSPPADRERLMRRVSLDLIGLPPNLAEADAFLADNSPDA